MQIKINLAKRRTALSVGDGKVSSASFKLDLSSLKELPIGRVALLVISVGLGLQVWSEYTDQKIKEVEVVIAKVNEDSAKMQKEINASKSLDVLKKQLESDEALIRNKITVIEQLLKDRQNAQKFLVSLSQALPNEAWLNKIKLGNIDIEISGTALGYGQISDFMKTLEENAFMDSITLKNTQQIKEKATGEQVAVFDLSGKRKAW